MEKPRRLRVEEFINKPVKNRLQARKKKLENYYALIRLFDQLFNSVDFAIGRSRSREGVRCPKVKN